MIRQTACKDCGAIVETNQFDRGYQYACPRCKSVLYHPGQKFDLVLVMAISSILFFIPTIFLPIMTIEIMGQSHSVTIIEAVIYFFKDGHAIIAVVASSVGVFIPLFLLFLILLLEVSAKLGRFSRYTTAIYRLYKHLSAWAMAEVYMVSIGVAIVKLSGMAMLELDFGLFCFLLFLLSFYVTNTWFNSADFWDAYEMEN